MRCNAEDLAACDAATKDSKAAEEVPLISEVPRQEWKRITVSQHSADEQKWRIVEGKNF